MGKILLYSTQLLKTGGIESHVFEFCRIMYHRGYRIDIVVPKSRLDEERKIQLSKYCSNVFLSETKNTKKSFVSMLFYLVKLRTNKYDVLYTNGQGKSIKWVSKLIRYKKFVHHHHTSGDKDDQALWPKSYLEVMLDCDNLIACSLTNAKRLSERLKKAVVDLPVFSRNLRLINSKKSISTTEINFGYFGRLIPEKGIDMICKLSNEQDCIHIKFHLWGEGPTYNSNSFNQYPNLEYHGSFKQKEELQNIIFKLDGYLLLSKHHEGLPVSLLESMSAGLPWLSTDKGGIPDLFVDKISTRLIKQDSTYEEIKNEVILFSKDCQNNLINSAAIQKFYNDKFSEEILTIQWEDLLSIKNQSN